MKRTFVLLLVFTLLVVSGCTVSWNYGIDERPLIDFNGDYAQNDAAGVTSAQDSTVAATTNPSSNVARATKDPCADYYGHGNSIPTTTNPFTDVSTYDDVAVSTTGASVTYATSPPLGTPQPPTSTTEPEATQNTMPSVYSAAVLTSQTAEPKSDTTAPQTQPSSESPLTSQTGTTQATSPATTQLVSETSFAPITRHPCDTRGKRDIGANSVTTQTNPTVATTQDPSATSATVVTATTVATTQDPSATSATVVTAATVATTQDPSATSATVVTVPTQATTQSPSAQPDAVLQEDDSGSSGSSGSSRGGRSNRGGSGGSASSGSTIDEDDTSSSGGVYNPPRSPELAAGDSPDGDANGEIVTVTDGDVTPENTDITSEPKYYQSWKFWIWFLVVFIVIIILIGVFFAMKK